MNDHTPQNYANSMAHGKEGLAGLGGQEGLVGLVDPNVAKQHKELAGFRSWVRVWGVCEWWMVAHGST